jgi:hypothetical protein
MELGLDTILAQVDETPSVTLEGRAIVLGLSAGSYFHFNRTGTQIWRMLVEPSRVGLILDVLSQTHGVDADLLKSDVTTFLRTLIDNRLVRVLNPAEHP